MDAKLKDLWLKALRSGEYEQGKDSLKDETGGYCCLGLLCHLAAEVAALPAGVAIHETDRSLEYVWHEEQDWGDTYERREDADLPDGAFGLGKEILWGAASRNDGRDEFARNPQTFAQIADWLETAVSVDPEPMRLVETDGGK